MQPMYVENLLSVLDGVDKQISVCAEGSFELLYANELALNAFGKKGEGYTGRNCYEFFCGGEKPCTYCPVLQMRESEKEKRTEVFNGKNIYDVHIKKIDWNGKNAYVEYVTDITEKKENERKLNEIGQVTSALLQDYANVYLVNTEDATIEVRKQDGYLVADIENGSTERLPYDAAWKTYIESCVHPDDKEELYNNFQLDRVIKIMESQDEYTWNYCTINRGLHHYQARYLKMKDGRVIAAFRNIDSIIRQEEKNRAIVDALGSDYVNVFLINKERKTIRGQKLMTSVMEDLGLDPKKEYPYDEFIKNFSENRTHPEESNKFLETLLLSHVQPIVEKDGKFNYTFRILVKGEVLNYQAKYVELAGSDEMIVALRNIDDIVLLLRLSKTDELTGLFNRNAYEEEINQLIEDGMKENFVYFIFDLNGLKKTNDTLGHKAGDELIIGAGACLKKVFKNIGAVYRVGGDEFIVLGYIEDSLIEKKLEELENEQKNWHGIGNVKLSFAGGYAKASEFGRDDLTEVMKQADKRMYESKRKYYQTNGIERRRC